MILDFFHQIILIRDFLFNFKISQYICHQSAILLVLNVYRPDICLFLSPIISFLPFPKELRPSGILESLTILLETLMATLKICWFQLIVSWLQSKGGHLYLPVSVFNYIPVASFTPFTCSKKVLLRVTCPLCSVLCFAQTHLWLGVTSCFILVWCQKVKKNQFIESTFFLS